MKTSPGAFDTPKSPVSDWIAFPVPYAGSGEQMGENSWQIWDTFFKFKKKSHHNA